MKTGRAGPRPAQIRGVLFTAALSLLLAMSVCRGQTRTLSARLADAPTDERIQAYEKRLASAPGDLALQIELVSAYLQKVRESGDYSYLDRASKIVEKILAKDGANETALRFENEIDLQRHEFRQVAERAEGMAKYNPSDPGTWANLGDALMELGEYERAGQAYTRMFALRPNLASYNRLAYFRFVTGDAATAITLMQQAVEAGGPIAENTAWCWAELGDMYFKTGKLSEARQAYEAALRIFPALHRAIAGLGRVDAAEGHTDSAIRNYERAQSIVPLVEYAGALEDLYAAAGMQKKAEGQRELIDMIDRLGKANGEKANRNLALLLADHDRNLPRALELVEAERAVRGDVYTWDALSWVLFKLKRYAEAADASRKAMRFSTPEPAFRMHARLIAEAIATR